MPKAYTIQEKREMALAKIAAATNTATEAPVSANVGTQKPIRTRRGAFNGTEAKMKVERSIPGYHMHWLNDYAGRIQQAVQGGYEFVTADEVGSMVNSNITDRNNDLGEKVRMLVGHNEEGGPLYAYLMKIPDEFWREDQQKIQDRNDQIDTAIRKGKVPGASSEGFYQPDGGIKIS